MRVRDPGQNLEEVLTHFQSTGSFFFFFNQFYILYSIGFQLGMILPPGDIWQCLEIFLAVTTGMRVGLLLASRVYRSVMLLNVL